VGIIRTSRTVCEHPEEAQAVIAARLGVPVDIVVAAWGRFQSPAALPDDLVHVMAEQEPWMTQRRNRTSRPHAALAALIDASMWREAQREPPATSVSTNR
jgi:hypothetical protein